MRRLLVALAILASGCATRGTIAELGRPEFSGTIPAQVELTLVEPRNPGIWNAYPRGAGKGDYHVQLRMEEPPHHVVIEAKDGKPAQDNVAFVMRATPTGDRKLKLFEVVAWPLNSKDEIHYKTDGHPPGNPEILRRVSIDKPIPDSEAFGVIVSFPAEKLRGFDHIAVSSLVQFEDGWLTIVDSAVLAPTEGK